jgi:hypothetical protein
VVPRVTGGRVGARVMITRLRVEPGGIITSRSCAWLRSAGGFDYQLSYDDNCKPQTQDPQLWILLVVCGNRLLPGGCRVMQFGSDGSSGVASHRSSCVNRADDHDAMLPGQACRSSNFLYSQGSGQ